MQSFDPRFTVRDPTFLKTKHWPMTTPTMNPPSHAQNRCAMLRHAKNRPPDQSPHKKRVKQMAIRRKIQHPQCNLLLHTVARPDSETHPTVCDHRPPVTYPALYPCTRIPTNQPAPVLPPPDHAPHRPIPKTKKRCEISISVKPDVPRC